MKRVAIVSATRAEYGILTPLIKRISDADDLDLDLIVTGSHLSEKYGMTVSFIEKDGFDIAHRIPILDDGNEPYNISVTMANAIKGFAECFKTDRPDMLIILGDRTEMLGVAAAAVNERIPIAHIHGGEVTEGAVDDCIRHAITKMSYLHFTSTEIYRRRVIQMGEEPSRVYNVGALSTENILHEELLSENDIREVLCVPDGMDYALVTFHPVTLEKDSAERETAALCDSLGCYPSIYFAMTIANSDTGSDIVNSTLGDYATGSDNAHMFQNLGMKRYLSAMKYARFVIGNSSSGIVEAPVMGTPTVNIGDRQKGRLMAESIISCKPVKEEIRNAIGKACLMSHISSHMYGCGDTSKKITSIIEERLSHGGICTEKKFYDIDFEV